jgi:hypothetical protein
MIKFKIKGAKVLSNKFKRASERADNNMASLIEMEVGNLLKRTIRDAPQGKTGNLKSSFRKNEISKSPKLAYEVFSDLHYAPYQEFGVKINKSKFKLASVHQEFVSFALNFESKKGGKSLYDIKARKYFLPNYILARRAISRKTKTIVNNLMK